MRIMKLYSIVISTILLTGCAISLTKPLTGPLWVSTSSKDEFTDQVTKMVTVGERPNENFLITQSLHYYPFVGTHDGEVYVGIRSGGTYRMPVGTVQLRIDDNPAWTINTEETPVLFAPKPPSVSVDSANMAGIVNNMQNEMMNNMSKTLSPYTAATGDKARRIIREMINGKVIKYRIIGFNQVGSSTGEVKIDESFIEALKVIGINPETL